MAEEKTFVPQHMEKAEFLDFLPHKGKMFLLSRVMEYNIENHTITTQYDITEDCIFYEHGLGGIPSWSGFEFMAQSISLLSAIERTINNQDRTRPGVVLSVQKFKSDTPVLRAGTTAQMKVREDYRADNVFRYKCELYENAQAQKPAATTVITVMEMLDIEAFFEQFSK